MQIQVSYNGKQIKELIQKDIEEKLNARIPLDELKIQVMSNQNYRVKEWEHGDLKVDLKVNI
ncbi:hypothetical protein KHA80_03105 [Anaerobacillus sp. HL2]|nr:hypothetical protein KHA80_03105 [Anaerobacillus sp. HL2]